MPGTLENIVFPPVTFPEVAMMILLCYLVTQGSSRQRGGVTV